MGIRQYRVAIDIRVSAWRIHEIVHGKRAITSAEFTGVWHRQSKCVHQFNR